MQRFIHHRLYRQELPQQLGRPKYALFENGHHPETIIELPLIELDMTGKLPFPAAGSRRIA